jgi:hypothetical protein
LNNSPEDVLKAVQAVAEDGVIRGTSQYRGTTELDRAKSAASAPGFPTAKEQGTVFFKIRKDTLSPEHFYQSADKGTVTVRYIVQPANEKLTRIRVDAIFQEDSGRLVHASDGQVEQKEIDAIAARLKEVDAREAKQEREVKLETENQNLQELQAQLDHETAQLQAAQAREQELEIGLKRKALGKPGRVKTSNADLKSDPHNEAKNLQSLAQGEVVLILRSTPYWYEVQAANGAKGWVYSAMLVVTQ